MAETISRDGPARRAAPPRTASLTLPHRYAAEGIVESSADALFSRLDDHARLSAHMEKPSWMMLGARMRLELDAGRGRAVGARIRLRGRVFGIPLFVEEEVVVRTPPTHKLWETLGSPRLLVIGPYRMGFEITPEAPNRARLRVFIEFALPERAPSRWLGHLFGGAYARWCVERMLRDAAARTSSRH